MGNQQQGKFQTYSTVLRRRANMATKAAVRTFSKALPRPSVSGTASRCQRVATSQSARSFSDAPRQTTLSSSARRHRPTIAPLSQPALRQTPPAARTIFIQTEDTPNADALKFKPNHQVLPDDFPSSFLEYLSPRSTLAPPHPSPLAAQLLQVDGVTSVFYGRDYITVTKDSATPWAHVKPEVFSIIIQELLETRIRPAIQEDGGDIEFRGFQDGQVMLKLRGACRTRDSSTVTLKNGIESMLMHYIEEVKGVQQVMDQEEEIAMKEFAKFEEKLKAQKGPEAVAGTVGKGSLDTVEA